MFLARFGPVGVEVNWEALVDTQGHVLFFGGRNTHVQGAAQALCSCLLSPAMADKTQPQKTHFSLAHMCWWISKLVLCPFRVASAVGKAMPTQEAPHCPYWGQGVLSRQGVRRQT